MATFASPTLAGKSWLNIATGSSCGGTKEISPASHGSKSAKCRGEFLVMLGHYGWIMSMQPINHPDAARHGGRIYVNRKDFRARSEPQPGDEVEFCVYADESGLGAEDCYVVGEAEPKSVTDGEGWVNTCPAEFQEDVESDDESVDVELYSTEAWHCHCTTFTTPNQQEWSSFHQIAPLDTHLWQKQSVCAFNTSYFADDSDSDSDDDYMTSRDLLKSHQLDDSSTQAGDSSDSESEKRCSGPAVNMAPPGLSPPPGLAPPPGLEFAQPVHAPPGLEGISPELMLQNRLQICT